MIPPGKEQQMIMKIQAMDHQLRLNMEERQTLLEEQVRLKMAIRHWMRTLGGLVRQAGGALVVPMAAIESITGKTNIRLTPTEDGKSVRIDVAEDALPKEEVNGAVAVEAATPA